MSETENTEQKAAEAPAPVPAPTPTPAAAPAAADEVGGRGSRKERVGVVVKAGAKKTVVVLVTRRVKHPKYSKYINRRKRYAAHDTMGVAVGDNVVIRETRPMSKTKRWRVVGKA